MIIRCYDECDYRKEIINLDTWYIEEISIKYSCRKKETKICVLKTGGMYDYAKEYRVIKEDEEKALELMKGN